MRPMERRTRSGGRASLDPRSMPWGRRQCLILPLASRPTRLCTDSQSLSLPRTPIPGPALATKSRRELYENLGESGAGIHFVLTIAVFTLAGLGLDRLFGTDPALTIVFGVIGFVGEERLAGLERVRHAGEAEARREDLGGDRDLEVERAVAEERGIERHLRAHRVIGEAAAHHDVALLGPEGGAAGLGGVDGEADAPHPVDRCAVGGGEPSAEADVRRDVGRRAAAGGDEGEEEGEKREADPGHECLRGWQGQGTAGAERAVSVEELVVPGKPPPSCTSIAIVLDVAWPPPTTVSMA
ncbi:MAG: AtpZ/AtpI family protein, partial [Bauldia sp.]